MKALRSLFLLFLACGPISSNPTWEKPCGGSVVVSVSAITLGDDCGSGGAALREAGDCAPTSDGTGCGFACRQSSVQLDIVSTAHTVSAFEVRAVRLYDKSTGVLVDTLSASEPKQWVNNQYAPWNQQIAPASAVKATYKLSTPNYYGGTSSGVAPDGRFGFSTTYTTQVDVAVDGEVRTLAGPEAHREPDVTT